MSPETQDVLNRPIEEHDGKAALKKTQLVAEVFDSPVQDVEFGTALDISLDHYYDLLKKEVGNIDTNREYLQLKLVADTIDLSDKKASEGGYKWWSYYNLVQRSDRAIVPAPILGEVQTSLENLTDVYGRFLRRLRKFVVQKVLTPEDQVQLSDLDKTTELLRSQVRELARQDRLDWLDYAEQMGHAKGDRTAYHQWSSQFGRIRDIERRLVEIRGVQFDIKTILDRKYPQPDDREVIDAEFDFENPGMRLRYPIHPDNEYAEGDRFDVTYLATLPLGSSALFDDRRVVTWDKALATMTAGGASALTAEFDRQTQKSTSITTDWKASASGRYKFIRVKASASQHKSIQEDFSRGTKIGLSSKSAYRVNIQYPKWFRATLFSHRHVKANPHEFLEFFGKDGSLLYYPVAFVILRGFAITFESRQNWTYDYASQFSASGGGGFGAFGISFGAKGSYSQSVKEHRVEQSGTKLSIIDDAATVRFVGYVVAKNKIVEQELAPMIEELSRSFAENHKG